MDWWPVLDLFRRTMPMDPNEFIRNCNAHTAEELAPYEGQFVAWSEDGKHILAHAQDRDELYREIDRRRLKGYVVGFIPLSDVAYFGGGMS
jgi:hypothetical protein